MLHIGLAQGGEKPCRPGVIKGKLHSVNGKNSSLETRKESGPIC